MHKKVIVKKNDEIVQFVIFHDEQVMNEWIEMLSINHPFGKPEHQVKVDENDMSDTAEMITVPSEYEVIIEDITVQVEGETRRLSLIAQGEKTALACKDAFNLIAGYNQFRALSSAQKDQMASLFSPIVQALKIYERPSVAKALVTAIEPDGILVTSEMKADMLEILKDF